MIATLLNVPGTSQELLRWSFANQDHHTQVVVFLKNKKVLGLNEYVLDPVQMSDIANFLLRHQQSHNEINDALSVSGNDLSSLNTKDPTQVATWIQLHFNEHLQWQTQTGIP
jgi:hypothetical protein